MRAKLIRLVLRLSAHLPLPLLHGIGAGIGRVLLYMDNRTVRDSEVNIALCFPELSARARRRLLRRSLQETGKTVLESGALWLRSGVRTLRLIRAVDGEELVVSALRKGRGVILVTPHLGAWEAAGLYCASRYNITCLYRPLRVSGLEQLVQRARSRLGGSYVPANARGIRLLYQTLGRGGAVAMLPDQEPQAGTGVFAPFFGIPAYSMVLLARLAAKSRAPVIFTWCERLPLGRGYRLHFREPPAAIGTQQLEEAVTATNLAVEQCVRECPAQYQWNYRRFRTRPPGEESFYKPAASRRRRPCGHA